MFFFVLAAAALLLTVTTQNAQAQSTSETPKIEVGVHYTFLRTSDGPTGVGNTNDSGVGGRVTYNLSDGLSLEGEVNQFPQGRRFNLNNGGISLDNKKTEGLFGVKYGLRTEKLGIFGKVRPGFLRFTEGNPSGAGLGTNTNFALDFGGVFELYPSRSIAVRFDLGDTVIRYNSSILDALGIGSFTTNNLQISSGVAFRF
jgi:hypothetical protein